MKAESLEQVRNAIDEIDQQLVKLIGERSLYVAQAAEFKTDLASIKAMDRVDAVIQKVRLLAQKNDIYPELIEKIYRNMIEIFTESELKEFRKSNV